MSKPTLQEVMNMTGRILRVEGKPVGLVGGMLYDKGQRPGVVRITLNRKITNTGRSYIDPDHPETNHNFTIYEEAEIERRFVEIVWPPLLIPPCYYYDVQIEGD